RALPMLPFYLLSFSRTRRPRRPTLFPYTTLFRSERYLIAPTLGTSGGALLLQSSGVVVVFLGLVLFFSSLRRFAAEGQGTLAPWDPPQHLVVEGPYRFVRNPMISGVVFILVGEAMLLRSRPHAVWALKIGRASCRERVESAGGDV